MPASRREYSTLKSSCALELPLAQLNNWQRIAVLNISAIVASRGPHQHGVRVFLLKLSSCRNRRSAPHLRSRKNVATLQVVSVFAEVIASMSRYALSCAKARWDFVPRASPRRQRPVFGHLLVQANYLRIAR